MLNQRTPHYRSKSQHWTLNSERGMALTIVIFVVALLLSITGSSLFFSGLELKVSSHHKTGTMAFFATEAGLNHAWRELENGDGLNDFDAIHASTPGTVVVSNSAFSGTNYTVTLLESLNNPRRIRVASVGTAPNNSQARLEVWLRRDLGTPPKAIITNGDLRIDGNPNIIGKRGGAHSNEDVRIQGNPGFQMADGLTASNQTKNDGGVDFTEDGMRIDGIPCIGSAGCAKPVGQQPAANRLDTTEKKASYAESHSNAPVETIPQINPADYASKVAAGGANHFILNNDGTVTTGGTCGADGLCSGGTAVAVLAGWEFGVDADTGISTWRVRGTSAASGVFYSEVPVRISGSPGSATSPWPATVISRDFIRVDGSPHIKPFPTTSEDLQNHLFVTGSDLRIDGNMVANYETAAILVHHQFRINGNPDITGFILANDGNPAWQGDPSLVGEHETIVNRIHGNPTITFNGDAGVSLLPPTVTQVGWYQSF